YDGLMTCVENSRVHGRLMSHPHTSHLGSWGRRALMYQAKRASPASDKRFKSTYGASGTGAIANGRPTSSGCSAPGIWLSVHVTSGPKYGQSPVAYQRRPIKKICVGSSKKNSRDSPYRRRKTKNAARATTAIATRRRVGREEGGDASD